MRKRQRTRKTTFKIQASLPSGYINYYDPLLEMPLDSEMESLISQVGARRFLEGMIKDLGVRLLNAQLADLNDYECTKACRAVIRMSADYNGTEMKQ